MTEVVPISPISKGFIISETIFFRPLQYRKTPLPMDVTLLGMVTEVRLQYAKACSPMLVTLLGMVTEVRLQLRNALSPMDVTLLGMTVFLQPANKVLDDVSMMALQLLRESYFVLPVSTMIEARSL